MLSDILWQMDPGQQIQIVFEDQTKLTNLENTLVTLGQTAIKPVVFYAEKVEEAEIPTYNITCSLSAVY